MKKAAVCVIAFIMILCFAARLSIDAGNDAGSGEIAEPKPFTVMLDTGHGGNDPGAVRTVDGVEYTERAFNDKLMNACYERLIQYDGVIVYRTRVANNHISTYARATYAHNVGADLFLSFHINSSSYKSARGASTIIPSGNYRKDLKTETAYLTETILSGLSELGLRNNGFNTRVLEDAAYLNYPDGSAGDYYEVIRMGVRYGIPSLILETAFITSDTDLAILKDDAKISAVGASVADSIAARYGLKITGNTLQQPVQTAQTSGVSLGSVPRTLNFGDIVPLTASGGSGEGEYAYLASNAYIGRIEGNNLIVIGSGDFRLSVTRYEGLTTTPRSSGNTNVTVAARSTSVDAVLESLDYNSDDGMFNARIKARLRDQLDGFVPRGSVVIEYGSSGSSADPGRAEGSFNESGDCVIELSIKDEGIYSCSLKYVQALHDGYVVPDSGIGRLEFDVSMDIAATPTPEPTEVPTEVPTEEPATEEPATPEPTLTATNTPEPLPTDDKGWDGSSVPFGLLEILSVLLIVAVVIVIVLVIKLSRQKRRR